MHIEKIMNWSEIVGGPYIYARVEMQQSTTDSVFTGNPRLSITYWIHQNKLILRLGDYDDFDLAKEYSVANKDECEKIYNKLLKYIENYDNVVVDPDEIYNKAQSGELFPQFDGVEMCWEL